MTKTWPFLLIIVAVVLWLTMIVHLGTPKVVFKEARLDTVERFSFLGLKTESHEVTFLDQSGARRFVSVNPKGYLLTPGQKVRIMWSVPSGYYIELLETTGG